MTQDAHQIFTDLPIAIPAFVASNADGSYTIILNSRCSREKNLFSYAHEYKHIINGDYEKKCSADLIEFWTHND